MGKEWKPMRNRKEEIFIEKPYSDKIRELQKNNLTWYRHTIKIIILLKKKQN